LSSVFNLNRFNLEEMKEGVGKNDDETDKCGREEKMFKKMR